MVEIIVKLPDEIYEDIKATYNGDDVLYCAVKYGIPLPKGHGRLIDEDKIKWDEIWIEDGNSRCCVGYAADLEHIPTIIEADKEVENADNHNP